MENQVNELKASKAYDAYVKALDAYTTAKATARDAYLAARRDARDAHRARDGHRCRPELRVGQRPIDGEGTGVVRDWLRVQRRRRNLHATAPRRSLRGPPRCSRRSRCPTPAAGTPARRTRPP